MKWHFNSGAQVFKFISLAGMEESDGRCGCFIRVKILCNEEDLFMELL